MSKKKKRKNQNLEDILIVVSINQQENRETPLKKIGLKTQVENSQNRPPSVKNRKNSYLH